jgi:spore coat polysaccharide biosynthesis protein SpsF
MRQTENKVKPLMPDGKTARVVIIIQARTASSRLPGKVLKDLGGQPVLAWAVERCRRARSAAEVVVATTSDPSDDPLAAICEARGWPVFRGSQFDVLDRFYQAARAFEAEVIVRVTADCPLIDADVIDLVVGEFLRSGADFAANRLPPPAHRTWPIGLDTEVCGMAGLERAWREATEKFEREHVMSYFYDQKGRFKVHIVEHEPDYGRQRWTIDTPEDLELLRALVARLEPAGRMDAGWEEVLALIEREPDLTRINAGVAHKHGQDVDARMK